MLLILDVQTEREVTQKDYDRIKKGIEKMGYAVHYRPDTDHPQKIIIEGADNFAEMQNVINVNLREATV